MMTLDQLLPKLLLRKTLKANEQKALNTIVKRIVKKSDEELTADEAYVMAYLNDLEHRYQNSVDYYELAVKKNPNFEAALNGLGLAYLELNKLPQALNAFEDAIEVDSTFTDAILGKAKTLRRMESSTEALELLKSNEDYFEENIEFWSEMAATQETLGNKEEALEWVNKALEIQPKDANLLAQRALINLFNDNAEDALSDFQASQRLSGTNYVTQFNLGLCYGMIPEKSKDANAFFSRSFKKNPSLLKDYFDTATKYEVERLKKHLTLIVDNLNSTDASIPGKFYRDELIELLSTKLKETA